ncbi:MAG: SDR family NAD(P)-dependent oxidoreductase [Clostridia bacterium]|nr:SDR family NAD(P)-dependent oxidoreductase [Clostridia bacterium]
MALKKGTKRWLSKNAAPSFGGKTVLITGATGGVGLKTAELMVFLKARVIMACRNLEKAEGVKEKLLGEYPDAKIEIMLLDLADTRSIDLFVGKIDNDKTDIDVFLNNAGVFHKPGEVTADGFDMVIGTNYLGVFYLSEKILPYLKTLPHGVDYINTVSIIHKIAKIDYNDFFYRRKYGNFRVYARSKLCLARYSYELSRRYEKTNVRIMMNHPGITITPLGINAFGRFVGSAAKVVSGLFNSNEKSALSVPYIMSKDIKAGSIVGPSKLFGGWGYPKINRVGKRVMTGAYELISFTEKTIRDHNYTV